MSTLEQYIHINTAYTRSINLERDRETLELVSSYLPTSRALQSLQHIAAGLNKQSAQNRALALIGPYGSGKSAFGLFVSALLAEPESRLHKSAADVLKGSDPKLEQQISSTLTGQCGHLRITVNGVPDSLVRQLMQATGYAAEQAGLPAELCHEIAASAQPGSSMDRVLSLIERTQQAWAKAGGSGVLIEIDELGKFLEYDSYHPQNREIHLLQLLAEHAQQPSPAPLQLMVMLHQAFEQYSQRLGKQLREEWQKVQGRFEAVAFLEPAEQSLQIISRAFEHASDLPAEQQQQIDDLTELIKAEEALPLGLETSSASSLFRCCYPLHPLTLLILPILCQKAAQNERTIFSYLGSRESYGLSERLRQMRWGDWIMPWELYDYFILNQSGGGSDPLTHHRWIEVVTALERIDAGPEDPLVKLLKTIGLLNLIGAQRGLKASREILSLLFTDQAQFDRLIKQLEDKSLIHYRHFSHEYRVWQGSDFDLRGVLEEAVAEHEQRPLAETLNRLIPLPPIIARRITIESGTLRRYTPRFTAAEHWPPEPTGEGDLDLWIYLATTPQDKPRPPAPAQGVIAVCQSTERLRQAVAEWIALQELPKRFAELQQDPVAQREHRNWLSQAEIEATRQIRSLLEEPQYLIWYLGDEQHEMLNRRDLQESLSKWMEEVYQKAPQLRNELINRDRPSPSANSGRKRLLAAMLNAAEQSELGIEKYPAEKSIYFSLLQQSRLHRTDDKGQLGIFAPEPGDDPCRILPLWRAISEYLTCHRGEQVSLPELYDHLRAPPYGVKLGPLPVLIVAYMLAHSRELAIYQEGVFCASLSSDQAELLCRRPELFALEQFELEGLHGKIFDQYMRSIVGNVPDNASLLDIVRPLVRFISGLPEYTKTTQDLSNHAIRVRDACQQARSPGVLLFDALPKACDLPTETIGTDESANVEEFISRLIAALRELKQAYPELLEEWQEELASALLGESGWGDLATLRQTLAERYRGLDAYTPDRMGLGAFIRRLSDPAYESDQDWLESLATLVGKAPPSKWRAETKRQARLRLYELGEQLRDLEKLYLAQPDEKSQDTMLLKTVDAQRGETSRVVKLSSEQRAAATEKAENIAENLEEVDEKVRIAIIIGLIDRLSDNGKPRGDEDE